MHELSGNGHPTSQGVCTRCAAIDFARLQPDFNFYSDTYKAWAESAIKAKLIVYEFISEVEAISFLAIQSPRDKRPQFHEL